MATVPLLPDWTLTLAYTLPLLCTSVVLLCAGSFLTIDRTRSFTSTDVQDQWIKEDTAQSSLQRLVIIFKLRGGVGGALAGFFSGFIVFTIIFMAIEREDSSRYYLAPVTFVVLCLLCACGSSIVGGLLETASWILAAVAGSISAALSLSIIVHPTLIGRIIILVVFVTTFLILSLVPKTRRFTLRLALATCGSFGLVFSVAVMRNSPGWSRPFERLWLDDSEDWGSPEEHGLSALMVLLSLSGFLFDWYLHRKYGQNPAEKWDGLLASMVQTDQKRAGAFTPLQKWYTRGWSFVKPESASEPMLPGGYVVDNKSGSPLTFLPQRQRAKLTRAIKTPPRRIQMSHGFNAMGQRADSAETSSPFAKFYTKMTLEPSTERISIPSAASTLVDKASSRNSQTKVERSSTKELDITDGDAELLLRYHPKSAGKEWNAFWVSVHDKILRQ